MRYDDLSQEMWNSADDNIPQAEIDRRLKLFRELQPLRHPPSEMHKALGRIRERERRHMEESDRKFNENYELAEVTYFDGGYTERWIPRKHA